MYVYAYLKKNLFERRKSITIVARNKINFVNMLYFFFKSFMFLYNCGSYCHNECCHTVNERKIHKYD